MRVVKTYNVTQWNRSKCNSADCDGIDCEHRKAWPTIFVVTLEAVDSQIISWACRKKVKDSYESCASLGNNKCKHTQMVIKSIAGDLEGFDKSCVEIKNINVEKRPVPPCPHCGQRWSVTETKKYFECRAPVCMRADAFGVEHTYKWDDNKHPTLLPRRDEWSERWR